MSSAPLKKRVLFVCSHNRVRSVTAEQVYRDRPDLEVRSAGIAEHATVPLTAELFDWADEVFVFSKRQRKVIKERFRNSFAKKSVVCLRLPDRFEYKSPKLVMKLTGKLGPYWDPQPRMNGPLQTCSRVCSMRSSSSWQRLKSPMFHHSHNAVDPRAVGHLGRGGAV